MIWSNSIKLGNFLIQSIQPVVWLAVVFVSPGFALSSVRNITTGLGVNDAGSAVFCIAPDGGQHFLINRSGQTLWHLSVEDDVRTSFTQISNGVTPSIAASSDGKVHVVYSEGWEIRYQSFDGDQWSSVQTLSSFNGNNINPSLTVGTSGRLYVVWVRNGNIWYSDLGNGNWSASTQITNSGDLQQYYPPRVAESNGQPVVVYGRTINGTRTGWFASRETGAWTHTQISGGLGAANGDISVAADGDLTVVWDMGFDIYSRTRDNGIWSQQVVIQGNSAESSTARIATSPDQSALAVWNEKSGGATYTASSTFAHGSWQQAQPVNQAGVSPDVEAGNSGFVVEWSHDWNIWTAQSFADTIPPPQPANATVTPLDGKVQLVWQTPACVDYGKVRVVFRTDRFPDNPFDGQVALERFPLSGLDSFTHLGLTNGTDYFYAIYLFDSTGNVSFPSKVKGTPAPISIGQLKLQPDGYLVTLRAQTVSAVYPTDGVFYVQANDRSAGIRVSGPTNGLQIGSVVTIDGVLQTRLFNLTIRSERMINTTSVTVTGSSPAPVALMSNNLTLGGQANERHVGAVQGVGLSNLGLLMSTSGIILSKLGSTIWIDDGSSVPDSSGRTGVFVRCPTSNIPFSIGQYVKVTGVLEGSVPSGWLENRRLIRLRMWDDIVQLN